MLEPARQCNLADIRDFTLQVPHAVTASIDRFVEHNADFAHCLALELARSNDQLPFVTFDKNAAELPGAHDL